MSYGQPCSRMTGGPSAGPSSAYPTLRTPASTCLSGAKDMCAGEAEAIAELATEVAATANPTVRAKSRRVITRQIVEKSEWTCKSKSAERCPPVDAPRRQARRSPHTRDPVGVLIGHQIPHHPHRDVHQERRTHRERSRRRQEPRNRQQQ